MQREHRDIYQHGVQHWERAVWDGSLEMSTKIIPRIGGSEGPETVDKN